MKSARWIRNLAAVVVLAALVAGCGKALREHLDIIRASAALGDRDMQELLGDLHMQGQGGVPLDYAEAARWYRKAAKQGSAAAQNNMGVFYVYGYGVPQDSVEAYAWFSIAAEQGFFGAAPGRDEAARWMTNAELGRAQVLAAEYRDKYVVAVPKLICPTVRRFKLNEIIRTSQPSRKLSPMT